MSAEQFRIFLHGEELGEHDPQWVKNIAQIWGVEGTSKMSSEGTLKAQAIVLKIKEMLANQASQDEAYTQCSSREGDAEPTQIAQLPMPDQQAGSMEDQRYGQLMEVFDSRDEVRSLLKSLFGTHSYGQAFDKECEIMLHAFQKNQYDLLWVRAEYIRIMRYLENTNNRPVIITGQPGIGILSCFSVVPTNHYKGKPGCSGSLLYTGFVGNYPSFFMQEDAISFIYLMSKRSTASRTDILKLGLCSKAQFGEKNSKSCGF